jgi:ankyrin repeat protein
MAISYLLQNYAELIDYKQHFTNPNIDTALTAAVSCDHLEAVTLLTDYDDSLAHLNARNTLDETAVIRACRNNNIAILQELLKKMPLSEALKSSPSDRQTALGYAVIYGSRDVVSYLYEHFFKTHLDSQLRPNSLGLTILMQACLHGQEAIVRYLLENFYDSDSLSQWDKSGTTPLMFSCLSGNISLTRYLLERHFDSVLLNHQNDEVQTAIIFACAIPVPTQAAEMADYMISHYGQYIDFSARNILGQTVLDIASRRGFTHIVSSIDNEMQRRSHSTSRRSF